MTFAFGQFVLLIVALLAQALFTHAKLVIVEAGMFNRITKREIPLTPGKVVDFCPKTFSANGFSIDCRTPGIKAPVSFFVNGKYIRTEYFTPYTLGGDYGMIRFPWKAYSVPSVMTVTCKAPGVYAHTAAIRFTCRPLQKKPVSPPAVFPPVVAPRRRDGCVIIKAGDYSRGLTPGWTREVDGSLTYRKKDPYGGVERAGTSVLEYSFMVPWMSQYAVTLDMTTRDYTEHNDVFVRFEYGGGLMLAKTGSLRYGGADYLKAYHNKKGRSTEAFSIDNNAHSFFTKAMLPPGLKLRITIGARSTQVTLHRIVLFPCKGSQCMAHSAYWQTMAAKCV